MATTAQGYDAGTTRPPLNIHPSYSLDDIAQPSPTRSNSHLIVRMANRGYDVVVDVDQEVSAHPSIHACRNQANSCPQGDLGHTDLQDDGLDFHQSSTLSHYASLGI
jgi:hypothetical protein